MKVTHIFLISVFYWIVILVSYFDMSEDCERSGISCNSIKVDFGVIRWGKCQRDNVLRRLERISLLDCVRECLRTTDCTEINYRHHWYLCDITTDISEAHFIKENGCSSTNISSWKMTIAGKCGGHSCKTGESCSYDTVNGISCSKTYCSQLPQIENATIVKQLGPHRGINYGIRYKCNGKDVKLVGKPLAVCRLSDDWDIMFKCETKITTCPLIEVYDVGSIKETTINTTISYRCSSGFTSYIICQEGGVWSKPSMPCYNYIGCFVDDENRLLKFRQGQLEDLSLQNCVHHCDSYTFLGLEAAHWCLCGNQLDPENYPKVEESDCNMPCTGDQSTMCGADWRISIYQIGD